MVPAVAPPGASRFPTAPPSHPPTTNSRESWLDNHSCSRLSSRSLALDTVGQNGIQALRFIRHFTDDLRLPINESSQRSPKFCILSEEGPDLDDEQSIIERAKSDPEQFGVLFERHYPAIFAYI